MSMINFQGAPSLAGLDRAICEFILYLDLKESYYQVVMKEKQTKLTIRVYFFPFSLSFQSGNCCI